MRTTAPAALHQHHYMPVIHHSFPPSISFRTTKSINKPSNFKDNNNIFNLSRKSKRSNFEAKNSIQIPHRTHPSSPTSSTPPFTSLPNKSTDGTDSDPELRAVLEVATDSELFDLEKILFGPSYLSPLLKSVTNVPKFDHFMILDDLEEREQFIDVLEARFLYLAADARSTLRGWRPSYRNVLLDVREQLNVPCSKKLPTEDLELEIFIHILHKCSCDWDTGVALRVGAAELCSVLLKGGQLISLMKISELVLTRLSGKVALEVGKHKIESEVIKKGFTGATFRAVGLRSLASFFGPILWGAFLADVVIQMCGTDYIRILQAIYAFAQIRILRKNGIYLEKMTTGF